MQAKKKKKQRIHSIMQYANVVPDIYFTFRSIRGNHLFNEMNLRETNQTMGKGIITQCRSVTYNSLCRILLSNRIGFVLHKTFDTLLFHSSIACKRIVWWWRLVCVSMCACVCLE